MSNILLLFAKVTMGEAKLLKGYMKKEEDGYNIYPNENKIEEEYKEAMKKSLNDFKDSEVELKIQDVKGESVTLKGLLSIEKEIGIGGRELKNEIRILKEGRVEIQVEKI